MFQYSAGRCLADKIGAKYLLDTQAFTGYFRQFSLDQFNIRREAGGTVNNIPVFKEREAFQYDDDLMNTTESVQLEGYWQNEKYFKHARKQLLGDFTPLKEYKSQLRDCVNENESVAVHYRRKDYLSIDCVQNICTENYYTTATDYIRAHVTKPLFVLFSDDTGWLKNVNMENSVICTAKDPVESLLLMSQCKHNIICNSSFSWWGAWLNRNTEKIVIAPKKWHNVHEVDSGILLDSWVRF